MLGITDQVQFQWEWRRGVEAKERSALKQIALVEL